MATKITIRLRSAVSETDRERALEVARAVAAGCAGPSTTEILVERIAIALLLARAEQADQVAEAYKRTSTPSDAHVWNRLALELRRLAAGL